MRLDERLSEAATALRERVDPEPVSLEKRRIAKRHRRRVTGALALLVVVAVIGAFVLLRDTSSSPRVGVSGGSGAPTVTTTTPGPRPVILRPKPSVIQGYSGVEPSW